MATENVKDPFQRHSIIYQSPQIKSPLEAKIILMAELHGMNEDLVANAKLIEELIRPRSILLLEGIRSKFEISMTHTSWKNLPSIVQPQLTCFGWDRYHHMARDDSGWICEYTKPNQDLSEMPDPHVLNFNASSGDWTEFPLVEELTAKDFPARTVNMIETLKSFTNLESEKGLNGRIFLIAGKNHLIQKETQDPRWSLKPLYEALEKLPALVVNPKPYSRCSNDDSVR